MHGAFECIYYYFYTINTFIIQQEIKKVSTCLDTRQLALYRKGKDNGYSKIAQVLELIAADLSRRCEEKYLACN